MPKSYTRPGVEGSVKLAAITNPTIWTKIESKYDDMIISKGGQKLAKLDHILRDEISSKLQQQRLRDDDDSSRSNDRRQQHQSSKISITENDLMTIVEWKFAKGKPRYALMKHLKSNGASRITNVTTEAFRKAASDDVEGALKEFCQLNGVGPATASAALCLHRPDLFCFMDDEIIECLYDGKRGYTLKIYLEVNAQCVALAKLLGEAQGDDGKKKKTKGDEWTPYRVGRALWTAARACAVKNDHIEKLLRDVDEDDDDDDDDVKEDKNEIAKNDDNEMVVVKKNGRRGKGEVSSSGAGRILRSSKRRKM